jgi:predicted AAA+ superfamily ATPase
MATLNMNATPETVWALLQEVAASQKETDKKFQETDKKFQETDKKFQETDKKFQESRAEYDRRQKKLDARMDELGKQMGGLHRSLGDLIETLMASRLWEKFPLYNFNRTFQRIKILDKNKVPVTEIDILLSDDEWAMAVEVKREPDKDDVKHHLKRMELMREYSLREISGKKLLGAIAGGVVSPDVREYAQQSGFFVLELNGKQVSLLASPEGFVALQG